MKSCVLGLIILCCAAPLAATQLNMSQDLVTLGIAGSNMLPNQPALDAGPLFMQAVNYAKSHGIQTVIADPGTYYFASVQVNTHVSFNHIDNMTIDLHGANLVFSHPLYYGIIVYYSNNATLRNFTVDYNPLPFTQVQVVSVDVANSRIQYAALPGWPNPSIFNSILNAGGTTSSEVQVHTFRNGQPAFGVHRMFTQLPFTGNTFPIVAGAEDSLAAVRAGDVVAIMTRTAGADAVAANHCYGCTFQSITVYAAGGGGAAFLTIPAHTTVMERIYAIPKPGTDRLISTYTAVALISDGPNNQVRLSRAIRTVDDGFAHGGYMVGTVQSQGGARSLTVAGTGGVTALGYGDTVPNGSPVSFQRLSDGAIVASAIITSQSGIFGSPAQITFGVDRDLPGNLAGTFMFTTDPTQNGAGSVFERNTVQNQAKSGRGFNIAGLANSTIRGNYLSRTAYSAIHGEDSTTPGESAGPPLMNLTVSRNVIDGTSIASDWWWFEMAAIQMVTLNGAYDFMTSSLYSNINITDNVIADPGRSAVWLGSTTGGSVTGNFLLNPNDRPDLAHAYQPKAAQALVPLVIDTTSSGITTAGNTVDNTSGHMFITDTQYRELAAYAPGSAIRLNAYDLGTLANPSLTLTDADGNNFPVTVQSTTTHAIDVQLPAAALGGAYITLTSGGTKYFGTFFIDSQDNIPAVNGCAYETSASATSIPAGGSNISILVITQAGCSYQVVDSDVFVTMGAGSTGTGVVQVGLAANNGPARVTNVEIGGHPIQLSQAASPHPTLNLSQDLISLAIAGTNMTPNQPALDAGPLFMQGVSYARDHGYTRVIADPGTYYFLSVQSNTHVAVSQIDNMIIDLQGASLIFTYPLYYGIIVYSSTNATLQNFTTDDQPLPFTQVRIVSVNAPNSQIQYTVQPGWQNPSAFNSMTGPGGSVPQNLEVHIFRSGQPVLARFSTHIPFSGDQFTVGASGFLSSVRPGDIAVIAMRGNGEAVNLNHCSGCTLRNITVYSSSGFAPFHPQTTQSVLLERVYAIPKPNTDRLVSTFTAAAVGIAGPNSQIRLSRAIRTMDDAFLFYGRIVGTVQSQSTSRTFTVAATTAWTVLGDTDVVANSTPVVFQRTSDGAVLASAVIVGQTGPSSSPPQVTYTFDRDLPGNLVGTIVYTTDANQNGANSVLERSTMQSLSCCKGAVFAGLANTTVRGNYIRRAPWSGIFGMQAMPGPPPSPPLANFTVTRNVIDGTNTKSDWWWPELGAIELATLTNPGGVLMPGVTFSNINVTDNFVADSGRSAVFMGNTSGGSLSGNYVLNANTRPDVPNMIPQYSADALLPLVVHASTGITNSGNTVDTVSGRMFLTDTQYRELAAYAPGSTIRLNAYNIGTLANPTLTLTDADGNSYPVTIQTTTGQALDVQLPAGAALGGAYIALASGGRKYFGTLFVDSQDNIPAVNGCTYETSVPSTSVSGAAGSLPILVVTQSGCQYQASDSDSFVTVGGLATGTGVVSVGFNLNSGAPRNTTIEIAGQPLTLKQLTLGALRFVPVTPCRIADTRKPNGAFGGPKISGGGTRGFIVPDSACGIPSTAQAYSLNVAVAPAGPLGYLTLWPAGQPQPLTANLNSLDGGIKSSAAIVPAGTNGAISVFASNPTDVVLDINGYFVAATDPSALAFYPITPCRIADTRKPDGQLGGPALAGQARTFPIPSSSCNIPDTAQAYSLNFAAVPAGPLGYLTAWPTGQPQPGVASLNALTGAVTANAAIVPAGTNGAIDIFASSSTHLVIDVNGYFAPAATGGLSLYNIPPCRVLDTRKPPGMPPFSGERDVNVAASPCGIPAGAEAFVLSATAVPPAALGYLTLWPQGQAQPLVSTLNALNAAVTSNLSIVPTNNGSIAAFPSNPTHLVLDIFGYFGQ